MVSFSVQWAPTNFKEFYVYYLLKHSKLLCRRLHVVGTAIGAVLTIIGIGTLNKYFALAGIAAFTAICATSDLVVQRIKPTLLEHPVWAVRADFRLMTEMIQGKEL